MKSNKSILDKIIEGINIVRIKNRNIKKIILGTGSLIELQMNLKDAMMISYNREITKTNEMELLGYPINTFPFLPYDYIGLGL